MSGLFQMAGGSPGALAQRLGASQETVNIIDGVRKPDPPPPEPAPVEPPPPAAAEPPPAPAATPPAPEAPAPETPAPERMVATTPDPYAGKRGEVQRLAQARARRAQSRATIIGSDTLG